MTHRPAVLLQACLEQIALGARQERGVFGEGDDNPVAHRADDNGDQRFDDKQPAFV